jgi:hypothetical protein
MLWSYSIFTRLILPIQEYGRSIHILVCSIIAFFRIFYHFFRIYLFYRGEFIVTILNNLILTSPLPSPPITNKSQPHINQLQEVSLFNFMYVYEAHQSYSLTFISSIHPSTSSPYTAPILQSCLSLLIIIYFIINYYKYEMEFHSVIRKNEIMWFKGNWMQLENIMLSEVIQVQKDKGCMLSLICRR